MTARWLARPSCTSAEDKDLIDMFEHAREEKMCPDLAPQEYIKSTIAREYQIPIQLLHILNP